MRGLQVADVLDFMRLMVLDNGERFEPEPFQVDIVEELCGGADRVWADFPEGQGKSTFAAALGLAHLAMVPDADIPVAAAARDQARVLLRQAAGIVRRSPELDALFKVQDGYGRIITRDYSGRIQVMAADSGTGDGVIPTLAILDELHRHANLDLMRTWGGKLPKRQGQMLIISTAGEPDGEYETAKAAALEQCRKHGTVTREGRHTIARSEGFAMHIWALDPDDDVEDLELVKQANPLSTITVETLRRKRNEPTWKRSHWARFTCGIATRSEDTAISEREWNGLPRAFIPAGETVDVGVDFGWRHDTTAIVPFWFPASDGAKAPGGHRRVLGPATVIEPPRDGTSTPPSVVKAAFVAIHERTPIRHVVMDPSAGGRQFAEWLEAQPSMVTDPATGEDVPDYESGLGVTVIEVSQGNVVQVAVYDSFTEAVRNGWIEHPGDPDLTRHVLNAVSKPVSHDRYRFDRASTSRHATKQDRRVIDALISASMVHWQVTAGLIQPKREFRLEDYRIGGV